uniref:Uncharacterized protein n=1 Tax=Kalanchoe fedtschenkoi TaxID=63787 RepID=A0A7N0TNV6_KALFE
MIFSDSVNRLTEFNPVVSFIMECRFDLIFSFLVHSIYELGQLGNSLQPRVAPEVSAPSPQRTSLVASALSIAQSSPCRLASTRLAS